MTGASHLHELALKKTPSAEKLTLHKAQVLECTFCASVQGPLPSVASDLRDYDIFSVVEITRDDTSILIIRIPELFKKGLANGHGA